MVTKKTPPVQIGQVIRAGVIGFNERLEPVVKYKGFILFVEGTKTIAIGQLIKLRVTKVHKTFGWAKVERK